eukprot:TRINITY_DN4035_c0_g1_i1.p1 TRINITY_DN4035_c0_g1~~TRINITY_DN4035_c0_g1_i1.p1  ORF type:complete len:384 (+),score=108.06 TRINITY_DN4035_c0_g1_i1:137-1288(+)
MWRGAWAGRAFASYAPAEIAAVLETQYGVHRPNAVQREALDAAAAGQDVLCVAQTGSGKTLVAVLPLLAKVRADPAQTALLVAPSPVLVAQHAAVAASLAGPTAVHVLGDAPPPPATPARQARVFVATPAAAADALRGRGGLDPAGLAAVAVDEADAVLCDTAGLAPGGEALLAALLGGAAPPQLVLTTAYLARAQRAALVARCGVRVVEQAGAGRQGVLVPSLRQRFIYISGGEAARDDALRNACAEASSDGGSGGSVLVFCSTAAAAERLAALLGPPTLALHEALAPAARDAALAALRGGAIRVLVSTGLAARGLDLPALRHVVLYDVPTDIPGYVHAAGRTARGGRGGLVTCLADSRGQVGRYRALHALQAAPQLTFAAA